AIGAVRILPNIHIAGVDVLYDETAADEYVIIEVNSRPQIGVNMYPSIGEGRDAPKAIIDAFSPTPRVHLLTNSRRSVSIQSQ
ncbi:hypothetical protein ACTXML_16960, partial [Glutamicibacter arilaitensis]|uniref:hypothetical protein n=1 Tax=Glutamicibacter arilaitensis TaxID=256701 RepID=UPI003FD49F1E